MKKVRCNRPNAKTINQWKDENGVIVHGPAHNELVTITKERNFPYGRRGYQLQEYKLPSNGWWDAEDFEDIQNQLLKPK